MEEGSNPGESYCLTHAHPCWSRKWTGRAVMMVQNGREC